ncbi:MAG: LuxR C-terminal-related transcriptional regulator [Alphaproteobacteria bacterium]
MELSRSLNGHGTALRYIAEAPDDQALGERFQQLIEQLGYAHFIYSHINIARETLYMICCTYPDEVRRAWAHGEVYWRDPLIPHLIKSVAPINRSIIVDDVSWEPTLMPTLDEFGIATPAWQFVVRDTTPFTGLYTIAAKTGEKERLGPEHYQAAETLLPALCVQAHETWRSLTQKSLLTVPKLSARELEILQLLSHGKSTEDVSDILSITERTVNYHVRNLKEKMKVDTRARAVAQGMRLQLI